MTLKHELKSLEENPDFEMILESEGVKTEQQLSEKLMGENWHIVKCIFCHKKISVLNCNFSTGDPACKGGCK